MTRFSLAFTMCFALVPGAIAQDTPTVKPGVLVTYTHYLERPTTSSVTRVEHGLGFAHGAKATPDSRMSYAARIQWYGVLQIVTAGEYTLSANVAGGSLDMTLRKDDAFLRVIEAPTVANKQKGHESRPVKLTPGVYTFRAVFERSRADEARRVELLWQGPGFPMEPIPHFFLGHLESQRPKGLEGQVLQEYGRFLYEELSCAKCHLSPKVVRMAPGLVEHTGPNLTKIAERVYPGWLDAWLADPAKVRPHTTMPKMFAEDAHGRAERYAVVKYLTGLGTPLSDDLKLPNIKEDNQAAERGKTLFTTTGCAACHANTPNAPRKKRTDDDDPPPAFQPLDAVYGLGSPLGPQGTYALGALGSKTRPDKLAAYLQDPLKTNPHGRMPGMALSAKEAQDLARHLCRTMDDTIDRKNPQGTQLLPDDVAEKMLGKKPGEDFRTLSADGKWKALGRAVFVAKGCANCHDMEDNGKKLEPKLDFPSILQISNDSKPVFNPQGCLSATPNQAPRYVLDDTARKALGGFVRGELVQGTPKTMGLNRDLVVSPITQTRASFKRYMCLNCHVKDGEGGIGLELAEKMKQLEKAENAEGILPPRLTGIGHKALTPWLRKVLLEGERARPWMGLRMPQYGEANVGTLPEDLASVEGALPLNANPTPKPDAAMLAAGRLLTGKDGYGCIACHDISGVAGGGTRGPDLALAPTRVRTEWFHLWMANPQRLSPGTQMPTYYLDGKAQNAALNGDMTKQIHALWAYANLGPGLPLPTGLEPPKGVVVAVKDKVEILRTFMPHNAGTRALAVGFPGGVNIAYDAQQARMAYVWAGNFLDATPVWTNRGGNPAKLLGPKVWDSPAGHPWAVIQELNKSPNFVQQAQDPAYGASLPEGQVFRGSPKLVFEGYRLDAKGQPTFRYKHQNAGTTLLTVEETPSAAVSAVANGITRKYDVTISAGYTAYLRVAETPEQPGLEGSRIPTILDTNEGRVILAQPGGRLAVLKANAPKGSVWLPRKRDGSTTWETLIRIPAGTHSVTVTLWFLPRNDAELLKELK